MAKFRSNLRSLIRADAREVARAWVAAGCPIKRELAVVPPCVDCGRIPETYARLDGGTVRCLDHGPCYAAQAARDAAASGRDGTGGR